MQRKKVWLWALGALALFGVLAASVGVAYGRFQTKKEGQLAFEAKPISQSGTVVMSSDQGWVTVGGTATLQFTLSGTGGGSGRKATLRLTATEAFLGGTVTLTVDGTTYTATAEEILPQDLLYAQMGSGTQYCFYSDGQELVWPLSANKDMTLRVQGVTQTALLRLVAQEK